MSIVDRRDAAVDAELGVAGGRPAHAMPAVARTALPAPPFADRSMLISDPEAWDGFVASASIPAYTQLTAWAEVKAPNGWHARRIVAEGQDALVGAQLLVHRLGPTSWSLGYAPRGPVAATFDPTGVAAFTREVRAAARRGRLSHVTVDPEVTAGDPLVGLLRDAGWTPAPKIQPNRTRLIDLRQPEEKLWADLRSKWRQYVNKARRQGVAVVEADASGLDDFYSIYVETARRAGFFHRAASAYRAVYEAYARTGNARLLFARLPDGRPAAALMLLTCGPKVVEPYGGMTEAGAEARANYLLKWEAIRSSREAGFGVYDMWGLAHPGIAQFKSGFGGREVAYAGAFELVTNRPVRAAVLALQRARVLVARRRLGIRGADAGAGGGPPGVEGDGG